MARKIWTTNDGRRIKMQKMTLSHMLNALRMMIKSAHERAAAQAALGESLFDLDGEEDWMVHVSDRGVTLAKVYKERTKFLTPAQRRRLNLEDELILELAEQDE